MGTIKREIVTRCKPADVWDAIRDIGALHTRLVPGFVVDTRLEPGARVVTFGNGMVVRERIISLDDEHRRIAWTSDAQMLSHYSASAQVFEHPNGQSRVVWTADFLPDSASDQLREMIEQGMKAMKQTLDAA
jgi:hypothetical protein